VSPPIRFRLRRLAAAVGVGLALGAGAAAAANAASAREAPARTPPAAAADQAYQRERAACLSGQTSQDRDTCLKEAGAARAAARRGRLDNGGDAESRAANATERCRVHADADDRLACERMARGEGRIEGSVAEGAVVKEMVTRSVRP
jgi:hypothetical protein